MVGNRIRSLFITSPSCRHLSLAVENDCACPFKQSLSLVQVGSSTFGSSTTTTRANLDCDFLHTWFYPEASAHCLRWNALWYEVNFTGPALTCNTSCLLLPIEGHAESTLRKLLGTPELFSLARSKFSNCLCQPSRMKPRAATHLHPDDASQGDMSPMFVSLQGVPVAQTAAAA